MADSDRDAAERRRPDEDLEEDAPEEDVDAAEADDEFEEAMADEIDGFDGDDDDSDIKSFDRDLPQKDQNARALAIRRAIEQRLEQKRLARDLDYLDLDLDDD